MKKKLNQPAKRPTQPTPTPAEIRETRLTNNQTQAQAATQIHATTKTWSQYEQGLRTPHPAFWELYTLKNGKKG